MGEIESLDGGRLNMGYIVLAKCFTASTSTNGCTIGLLFQMPYPRMNESK
jgi:hypothetical protein